MRYFVYLTSSFLFEEVLWMIFYHPPPFSFAERWLCFLSDQMLKCFIESDYSCIHYAFICKSRSWSFSLVATIAKRNKSSRTSAHTKDNSNLEWRGKKTVAKLPLPQILEVLLCAFVYSVQVLTYLVDRFRFHFRILPNLHRNWNSHSHVIGTSTLTQIKLQNIEHVRFLLTLFLFRADVRYFSVHNNVPFRILHLHLGKLWNGSSGFPLWGTHVEKKKWKYFLQISWPFSRINSWATFSFHAPEVIHYRIHTHLWRVNFLYEFRVFSFFSTPYMSCLMDMLSGRIDMLNTVHDGLFWKPHLQQYIVADNMIFSRARRCSRVHLRGFHGGTLGHPRPFLANLFLPGCSPWHACSFMNSLIQNHTLSDFPRREKTINNIVNRSSSCLKIRTNFRSRKQTVLIWRIKSHFSV